MFLNPNDTMSIARQRQVTSRERAANFRLVRRSGATPAPVETSAPDATVITFASPNVPVESLPARVA